jgi:hypothetical protein
MGRTLRYHLGMRVTRQTATELVLEDSCLWIAGVLAIVSVPLFYAGAFADSKAGHYATGALFLLLALPAIRKSRFVFDARERVVRWRNFLMFRTSAGSLPFDAIRGIGIEAFSSEGNNFTYRLTILTSDKPVPLSSAYSPGKEKYTNLRKTIATFLNLETGSQEGSIDVDPSVVELVRAGRKIAAIELLRSMKKMSLLDAKRIVDEVESGSQMKS